MEDDAVPPKWEQWLPPSPHREPILEFLRQGRATIVPRGEDEPPLVEFEDGGVMELDRVRCSPERRFYRDGS